MDVPRRSGLPVLMLRVNAPRKFHLSFEDIGYKGPRISRRPTHENTVPCFLFKSTAVGMLIDDCDDSGTLSFAHVVEEVDFKKDSAGQPWMITSRAMSVRTLCIFCANTPLTIRPRN